MDRPGGAAVLVVLAVIVGALVGLAGPVAEGSSSVLVVEAGEGTALLTVPVDPGSTVTLEYTHSVEKSTVRDVYTVANGQLVMTRMEFSSFGAGLPSEADVEQADDGTYVYHPPDRRRGDLYVATGRIADHDLVVDGQRYDLVELADAGTVRLSIDRRKRR